MNSVSTILLNIKLDRRRPLRDQIYPLIRDLIIDGTIKPGDAIDEKAIATSLRISRTPVREAVKKLSDEHLVDVVAQSGTHAARMDGEEIKQAYLIRRALEMESAAHAAPRMTPAHSQNLLNIIRDHDVAMYQAKFGEAILLDDSFHRYITSIAALPRLWHMIEISKAHLDRCRHMLLPRAGEAAATLHQHRAIVSALNSTSAEAAREAMRFHLESSYAGIEKMLAEIKA